MKQKLEDFIAQNREAFDDQEPDNDNVWARVSAAMSPRKSWWHNVAVWRAAAVVFMAVSAYLFVTRPNPSATTGHGHANEATLKEFHDVEEYYEQQMAEKVHLINQFKKAEGLNGFTQDFQQLEAMYMVLREEMKARPSKKVKEALVLNLLVRVDLLNQQIHKLEQQYGDEEDEDKTEEANV